LNSYFGGFLFLFLFGFRVFFVAFRGFLLWRRRLTVYTVPYHISLAAQTKAKHRRLKLVSLTIVQFPFLFICAGLTVRIPIDFFLLLVDFLLLGT
jgi:hypothetical protein